ncbi:hypothetical protein OIDMADRAFT_149330 [Oidiodendron maius Zn]|uniref:Major facilitator superfamily (MFS) profile domain-containing protein n=1 Tax=Oidiodendron maius (strain Zn) TaxID=913774 RepID=A0A0C3CYE3_OIDMZ|nr:hypothetical protein OIDMADRAFT_149330 [Oidiodendron maius Zn]
MGRFIPSFTLYNWGIVMLISLGNTSVSYGLGAIAGALGQGSFYEYMHLVADASEPGYSHTSNYVSACTGCLLAGAVLGVCVNGWGADFLGRKLCLQVGAVIFITGGALQAGSVNQGMYLGARFITGVGMGSLWTTIPMYQAELSTPDSRGFMVSMTGVMFALGYSLNGWINFGTYYAGQDDPTSSFSWRFPLAFQVLPALLMFIGSPMLPSSPRWLIEQGRHDEALVVLRKLHAEHAASNSEVADDYARREYIQMTKQIAHDTQIQQQIGRFAIFRTAPNRKRLYLGFGILWGCQFLGLTVIGTYGVLVYDSLGLHGSTPLLLQSIWVSISLPGNFTTALFVDKLGRRTFLMIGSISILVCLIFNAALQSQFLGTSNRAGQNASVFFIFLMIVFWSSCLDATQFVYLSEIFPSHLRSQGQAVGMLGWVLSGIVLLVAAPIAMDTIHWKFLLINICCTVVFICCLYFFYPETKGKSIEDINAVFGETVVLHFEGATKEDQDVYEIEIAKELVEQEDVLSSSPAEIREQ